MVAVAATCPPADVARRLVHVITGLDVGGAELTVERMVPALESRGWRQAVVSLTALGSVGVRMRAAGVEVHDVGMDRHRPDPRQVRRLRCMLHDLRPGLVQTWLYHADLLGALTARGTGAPVCWNLRQSDTALDDRRTTRLLPRVAAPLSRRLPAAIVTNSQASARFHVGLGYDRERIVVIPNGVDTDRFRPNPAARRDLRTEIGACEGATVLGFAARFDPTKDHRTLLAAFARLAHDDAHLVLVGPGCDRGNAELADAVATVDRSPRIHLLGVRDDMPNVLAGLDLYVHASRTEGMPNALGEAMACGVPCVATDVGDTGALGAETVNLVEPGSPGRLREAIDHLLALPAAARAARGAAGRDRIETSFTHEAAVDAYDALYRSVVGTPVGAST